VLDEDGTVLGTVGVARDISDRKAAEAAREMALAEAQRLARMRSEFLAQMSHELRTPLNGILGFAQILQHDKSLTPAPGPGGADHRRKRAAPAGLIDDILDMARIDAAKVALSANDFDLSTFLQAVCDIVRVKAEEKNLLFSYRTAGELPPAVHADEKRLRQVLLNLLSNAIKFTDRGEVTLRVQRARCKPPAGPGCRRSGPGGAPALRGAGQRYRHERSAAGTLVPALRAGCRDAAARGWNRPRPGHHAAARAPDGR
jgi:signal transduction histidine kinase